MDDRLVWVDLGNTRRKRSIPSSDSVDSRREDGDILLLDDPDTGESIFVEPIQDVGLEEQNVEDIFQ